MNFSKRLIWIFPVNPSKFKIREKLNDSKLIEWGIGKSSKIKKDDIVLFYLSKGFKKIFYKLKVVNDDFPVDELANQDYSEYYIEEPWKDSDRIIQLEMINEYSEETKNKFSYKNLKKNGLKATFQNKNIINNNNQLLEYFLSVDNSGEIINSQGEDLEKGYPEGGKKQIMVNAYERSEKARKECIEHYGYNCAVCGFDFKSKYGEIGENFIHVHHKKPLSEINEGYQVDPINDLVPVCANCHTIIHRRKPALTIEDVKNFISNNS